MLICISFGGSHLQVGLIDGQRYIGHPPINWRDLMKRVKDPDADDLAAIAYSSFLKLVESEKLARQRTYSLGIAFPGPKSSDKWYSNNLTEDFKSGVDLLRLIRMSFEKHGVYLEKVVCRLDAQADAGAEVYHPRGRLALEEQNSSIVLNLATGIAAGFVTPAGSGVKGRVLCSDNDISAFLGDRYDKGVGQLGRHILFSPRDGSCFYDFRLDGGTAFAPGTVRLSEYLSGPALVSRFGFLKREVPPGENGFSKNGPRFAYQGSTAEFCEKLISSNHQVRQGGGRQVRQLINLLNLSAIDSQHLLHKHACWFREILIDDFSSLFSLLRTLDGWREFTSTIIVSGGLGQNLFATGSSDFFEEAALSSSAEVNVRRSILPDGCERAAYYFYAVANDR